MAAVAGGAVEDASQWHGLRVRQIGGDGGGAKLPNATPETANERAGGWPKLPSARAGGIRPKLFLKCW